MTCVSVGAAALLLSVSISTLRRWDASDVLTPSYRTPGGHRRYQLDQLMSFMGRSTKGTGSGLDMRECLHQIRGWIYNGNLNDSLSTFKPLLTQSLRSYLT